MLQGDVHRFYEALRRAHPTPGSNQIAELDHVRAISAYYEQMQPADRRLLLAWAKKEESGIGIIPTILSGIPLLGLIFSPLILGHYRHIPPGTWLILWGLSAVTFSAGIYVHHRQKAYATLHVHLLEQLCQSQCTSHIDQSLLPLELPFEAAGDDSLQ